MELRLLDKRSEDVIVTMVNANCNADTSLLKDSPKPNDYHTSELGDTSDG